MFGIGKKKVVAKPEVADPAFEEKKESLYKPEDESIFHSMPQIVKTHYQESKKAQSTGKLILIGGGSVLMLAVVGMVYYMLKPVPVKKVAIIEATSTDEIIEVATTTNNTEVLLDETKTSTSSPLEEAVIASSSLATSTLESAGTTSTSTIDIAATSTEEQASTTVVIVPPMLEIDTDGDGLLDPEELVFGTKVDVVDSDKDGFSDMSEISRGYNPAGVGKLSSSKSFKKFENANFVISYPTSWQPKASDNDLLIFEIADNQMVQISMQPNVENQSVVEWYRLNVSGKPIENSQLSHGKDINNNVIWDAVMSEDGLTYYVVDALRQNIVTINYNLGPSNKVRYPTVFKLMMESYRPI